MAWKQTSHPTVQKHRDKWVVCVDGIDTVSGARKPRQLGTYPSRRSAQKFASAPAAAGDAGADRGTVAAVVDRWVVGKVDVSSKIATAVRVGGRTHRGFGGVRLDHLDRVDVAEWLEQLAAAGGLSRRSIQIMRMVLNVALDGTVDVGDLRRNPASRVGMPRNVATTSRDLDRTPLHLRNLFGVGTCGNGNPLGILAGSDEDSAFSGAVAE